MGKCHIGIDAHVLGSRAGGNETYMRNLLDALRGHAPGAEITAFVNAGQQSGGAFGFPAVGLPVRSSYLRVPVGLPYVARRAKIDVLHVQYTAPPWSPCAYVVSMHDIVALRHPESMPALHRRRLEWLTPRTLKRAARVFVLTNAIRDDIAATYGVPLEKFDLVQPAPHAMFRRVGDEQVRAVRGKYRLPERYVLYVGLLQPRKNLLRLAQAFSLLRERGLDHKLVIVGKRAWLYGDMLRQIHGLGLDDRIVFTDYVDTADLPALYSGAGAFAYVSLYEGFGIPLLEALACGVASVTSTDPALTEVGGGYALRVDPRDVEGIAGGLEQALGDEAYRARVRAEGPSHAALFSPAKMAAAAMRGYERACGEED